jgi:hypothetical protein
MADRRKERKKRKAGSRREKEKAGRSREKEK